MSADLGFFLPENRINLIEGFESPSGRWGVRVERYKTKPGFWDYTKGIIYDKQTGQEVVSAYRNYGTFFHQWIVKDDHEYLMCSENYMGQSCVDPESKIIVSSHPQSKENGFCWSGPWSLSPDGKIIAVCGCYWGAPYEVRFFDFTDPNQLPYEELLILDSDGSRACLSAYEPPENDDDDLREIEMVWNEDGTFSSYKARVEGKHMIVPAGFSKDGE